MEKIDVSGAWRYETDEADRGIAEEYYKRTLKNDGFLLPGSACENKVGKKQEYYHVMNKDTVRAPRERYEYIGALWLQREIEIPKDFEGKEIRLFLERVNIASTLWVDGEQIDRQIIGLSTPHMYRLTGRLLPGRHTFTLRIENTDLVHMDKMASGYSIDTQGYWNGIIGKMELQCEEICHIDNIQIYPEGNAVRVKAVCTSGVHSPLACVQARLVLTVREADGKAAVAETYPFAFFTSKQVLYVTCRIGGEIHPWSEYDPYLYTLSAELFVEQESEWGSVDRKEYSFGMREIAVRKKRFCLNGQPISLRGTTNCAIYPLTGYPPTELEAWREQFRVIKSYGLNYMRFHAWCPPENAFLAADEAGVYVSVEMPLWLNMDVCDLETGEDPIHSYYYEHEAAAISKCYGNHPSFLMFSNGNELLGDFEMLDAITTRMKAYDNRRLYTLTSNFDHTVLPCEDYFCAFEAYGHPVRIQNIHDTAAESTTVTYRKAVDEVPAPIVSFEIGQYCVYPDVDGEADYTGNLVPVNLAVIKEHMIEKGVYERRKDYIRASGDLAAKLYKEDIEAALRTKGFGGFGLLSLCDYTGQCTATVGILDAFYKSKGILTPEEFRQFCNDGVPLFLAKRIYSNREILTAELDFYDYRKNREGQAEYEISVSQGNKLFYRLTTEQTEIKIPLQDMKTAAMLTVEISVLGYRNSWRIFVYPEESKEQETPVLLSEQSDLQAFVKESGRAIVTAGHLKRPIRGSFVPVFWSPAFFETDQACGALIAESHPAFGDFPTGKYPDYQWKTLLEHSAGADISAFGADFEALVEPVPNFFDNIRRSPLFEVKVGKADLLFCGFDLNRQDIVTRQLRRSLYAYVCSEAFAPRQRISEESFLDLFS